MTEPAALERGLPPAAGLVPASRSGPQREEEILAVLMAGAEQGQRRPRSPRQWT